MKVLSYGVEPGYESPLGDIARALLYAAGRLPPEHGSRLVLNLIAETDEEAAAVRDLVRAKRTFTVAGSKGPLEAHVFIVDVTGDVACGPGCCTPGISRCWKQRQMRVEAVVTGYAREVKPDAPSWWPLALPPATSNGGKSS